MIVLILIAKFAFKLSPQMGRLSAWPSTLTALYIISSIFLLAQGQTLAIESSSAVVGEASVNYTFVLRDISASTGVAFNFGSWSPLTQAPFSSSTKCYLAGSALSCVSFPTNQINCVINISGSFNLTLTFMSNPSSSRPYSINVTLSNSTASRTLSSTLTVSTLANYPLSFISYSRVIGATSSSLNMDIVMNNYIDSTTFLSLSYNNTLISIIFPNTTSYTVLQNTNGNAIFSNWNNLASLNGKVVLSGVSITNPQAAISYTVTGLFYFRVGGITYNIQTVSATITLTATAFSTLSIASPLQYGVLSTLAVTSSCAFTQLSSTNTSNPAYTIVTFPTTLVPNTASTCVTTSSTTCQHTRNLSYSLSNFQAGIGNFSAATLTFTSFTFYAGAYYPLCRSTVSVSFTSQTITPYIQSSECDTNVSSFSNTVNIYSGVQSVAAGDVIFISGLKGVVSSAWTQVTMSNVIWYSFVLAASNIAVNGSSFLVTVPLSYNNPNETVSNSISQVALSRNSFTYATSNSLISMCSITAGRPIASHSIVPSTLNTYEKVTISLGFSLQIFDYAWDDYLILQIGSSGLARQYFLAGALVGITPNLTVNGIYCTFSIVNDFTLKITLNNGVSLPSSTTPTISIVLLDLVNPPAIDTYWFSLTSYDLPTLGIKQVLTTSSTQTIRASSLTYSIGDLYQLANNIVSLVITNENRLILSKNNVSASTTLTATLPSTLNCSNYPSGSVTATWNVGILTSSSTTSGTSTSLTINLGTCFVSYFSSSTSFTVTQSFLSSVSTSTSISSKNKCGTCYQCSGSTCTACFNATYTTLIYFYNAQCYSTCPSNTFTQNTSCVNCHPSCQSCVGSLYTNCTSCSSGFTLSSGYCGSVCGTGKYQSNGACVNCHPNCDSCLSSTLCYVCKASAVMIGTQCQFTSCTSPCQTCLGSLTTCTSCISSYFLYKSQCLSSCPSGTYPSGNICEEVSQSSTYVPVTITGVVCFGLLVLLRVYSSKKIGNDSRRRKSYEQEETPINYKINLLRVASVLFSYLQLAAALVILLKNSTYSVGGSAVAAIAIGLVFHLLSNIAFLVAYFRMMRLKRVDNQNGEELQEPASSMRYKAIIIFSVIFTFRTYKLLEANLFLDRHPSDRPREGIPSRKLIRSNSLGDEQIEAAIQPTNSAIIVPKQSGRFAHPFLTYLTIIDLFAGTLVVLIGAVLQVLSALFPQMLLWGLDCLLVGVCSLALTGWDLWAFVNLHPSEQHSEMSSRNEANNTHQNLKQLTDFDIKIQPDKQNSPKRTNRGKMSQRTQKAEKKKEQLSMEGVRSGIKRQCDEVQTVARDEPLPKLKVFEDFDEKDQSVLNQKKTKKFSTKNLKRGQKKVSSRRINPTSHHRNQRGEVCDDLYINFAAEDRTHAPTINATNLHSRRSVSPRSLQEQSIEVGGDFEQQPPNFADISDIEQGNAEPNNISLSSEPPPAA